MLFAVAALANRRSWPAKSVAMARRLAEHILQAVSCIIGLATQSHRRQRRNRHFDVGNGPWATKTDGWGGGAGLAVARLLSIASMAA